MINSILNSFLSTTQKSKPSKTRINETQIEIIHKKCGNTLYYVCEDIHFGDMELISPTETLQRGYLNCPHCKGQLVFDYNDTD